VEFSSLENENDYKNEKIYTFVENVTPLVIQGSITNDNPSPSNGLSGLEQVILFAVGPYMDDIYNMEFIKALIIVQKATIEKQTEELLSGDDEWENEWEEDEWEEEDCPEDPYWNKPYIEDNYYEEFIEPEYEQIYYKIDDPEFKKKVKRIATGYLQGIFTEDNQSKINGLTGIGQVVSYVAELLYPDSKEEKREDCTRIEKMVQGYILDLRGGAKMSAFGEDLIITPEK